MFTGVATSATMGRACTESPGARAGRDWGPRCGSGGAEHARTRRGLGLVSCVRHLLWTMWTDVHKPVEKWGLRRRTGRSRALAALPFARCLEGLERPRLVDVDDGIELIGEPGL